MYLDTRSQAHWQQQLKQLRLLSKTDIWWNPTNQHSLRLTKLAIGFIPNSEYYIVDLASKIIPRHFILLERGMSSPYYIKKLDQLYVFDQTVAIMLTLHSGDLDTCLSNLINYG